MMVTCAIDKTVAVWDTLNVGNHSDFQPIACGSKEMNVGKLYTTAFYPSSPWILGCGGGGNELALWDMSNEAVFQKRFGARLSETPKPTTAEENSNETKTEDFEALMAASDKAAAEARQESKTGKKKKKNKNKKKVHRKR